MFGWVLPDTHILYKNNLRSIQYVTVSQLMQEVDSFNMCCGINVPQLKDSFHLKKHAIQKSFSFPTSGADETDLSDDELHPADVPSYQDEYTRSINCSILIQLTERCSQCKSHSIQEIKINNRKKKVLATPASLKAPISLTSPERILLTLRRQRAENEELHKEIVELKEELHHSALPVTKHLHDDLQNIIHELFENCDARRNISPFMKLFLQEQISTRTGQIPSNDHQVLSWHPCKISSSI